VLCGTIRMDPLDMPRAGARGASVSISELVFGRYQGR